MQIRSSYLVKIARLLVLTFLVGRVGFVAYNATLGGHGIVDIITYELFGFWQDVETTLYLLTPFALVTLMACLWRRLPLRWVLAPYALAMGVVVGAVVVFDAIMYRYWQFKLGSVMLAYAASPEGATNSVSPWYIAAVVGSALSLSLVVGVLSIRFTPRYIEDVRREGKLSAFVLAVAMLSAIFYDGGMVFKPSRSLFANHAATNPVYNFCRSFHVGTPVAKRFHTMEQSACDSLVSELYLQQADEHTDTLLRTSRPDILLVMMESFGGQFVKELGGYPEVAPNLSRLIQEGVWWENYYSSSFRTDRGTVSLLSGMLPLPDVCLMKETQYHDRLASLPRSLQRAGYRTLSLMGQPMTNMGKGTYLQNMGLQTLDYTAFTPEERQAAWGAHDDVSAQKAVQLMAQKDSAEHLFLFYQTISSHEPWDVPYNRLENPVLNAFAYTDAAIGAMVDSLKQLPVWDNLLIIILPDHGYLYKQTYETPEFFHAPMLWTGGAIRQPRKMDVLMNQSDVAATLLAQLALPYTAFRWSRNVLGSGYTKPFVYSNYPAGMMWKDASGATIYELDADRPILQTTDDGGVRLKKAQAVLQASYEEL